MSTHDKRKSARKEATPEQKAAAVERKKNIREMFSKISALPIEKRVILAAQYGLRTAGTGHELSPSNTLLVMLQFPSASVVGGFEQWRKAGRVVKKGVKAIGIWVPIRGREAAEGEDGKDTFFMIGNVFDISQTVDAVTGAEYDGSGWKAPAGVENVEHYAFPEARLLGWTPDAVKALPAPVEVVEAEPVAEYEAPEAEPVAVEVVDTVKEEKPRGMSLKPRAEELSGGEVRAVSVEQVTTKAHKSMRGWGFVVRYTFTDGSKSTSDVTARLKADLAKAIEREVAAVAAGAVTKSGGMIMKKFTIG